MVKVQKVATIIKKAKYSKLMMSNKVYFFVTSKRQTQTDGRTDRQTDSFTQNNDNNNNNNNEIKSQNKKAVVFAFILMMFNKNS